MPSFPVLCLLHTEPFSNLAYIHSLPKNWEIQTNKEDVSHPLDPHPLEAGTVSTRAFVQRIHRHIDATGFMLLATQHFVAGPHTSHYGPLLLNVALAELPSCLVLNISFQWFHCTERHLLNGTLSPLC